MTSMQITSLEGPAALESRQVAVPVPRDGEVFIRVRAAGVSFPEVLQSRGLYQLAPPLPFIPGSEVAGEVVSAPAGSDFAPGDRVVAFTVLGGFAEYAVAQTDLTFPLPGELSFEQAAGFGLNYLTAYFALVERGAMRAGESVLVHGAGGGIGTATIQVARAFGAGRIVAVVSTAEKGEVASAAGADVVVMADGFREALGEEGRVDLVVDPVGGDRFTDSLRVLAPGGRLLVIGFAGGEIPSVKVNRLLLNNTSVVGVGWGAYTLAVPGAAARQWSALAPHIASRALSPVLGAVYGLADASRALLDLDERTATGKIVLRMPD
ncbi:MAG: NADPH:quinone oxidoreductase family protein [Acidobacteria bacterium]|nr:NADPH:quinone oxidoreductase family protein [Acidobacteriota bacterium]